MNFLESDFDEYYKRKISIPDMHNHENKMNIYATYSTICAQHQLTTYFYSDVYCFEHLSCIFQKILATISINKKISAKTILYNFLKCDFNITDFFNLSRYLYSNNQTVNLRKQNSDTKPHTINGIITNDKMTSTVAKHITVFLESEFITNNHLVNKTQQRKDSITAEHKPVPRYYVSPNNLFALLFLFQYLF